VVTPAVEAAASYDTPRPSVVAEATPLSTPEPNVTAALPAGVASDAPLNARLRRALSVEPAHNTSFPSARRHSLINQKLFG
jgi:hypothetical protein